MNIRQAALAAVFTLAAAGAAQAQIVISGNDGHELEKGQAPLPDTVSIINFSKSTPRLLASVEAPASLVNAPAGVAISRNGKLAIVVCNTKIDPANPMKVLDNDAVTVLDISNPSNPKIVQSLHAGASANGVTINRAENEVLVANAVAHSVSVFTLANGRLTPAGTFDMGNVSPTDIAFLPDGKSAVASTTTNLVVLSVNGTNLSVARTLQPAIRSSNVLVTANGKYALVNGAPAVAGAAPAAGGRPAGPPPAVTMVDLSSGAVVSTAPLEGGVEGIELSPDGRYLAGVVGNGSHNAPGSAGYHDFGLVQVFSVTANTVTSIGDAHTGHWCQGAAFSRDDHTILVQCSVEGDLEAFNFDGKTITPDPAHTIKVGARPGTIGEQPLR